MKVTEGNDGHTHKLTFIAAIFFIVKLKQRWGGGGDDKVTLYLLQREP